MSINSILYLRSFATNLLTILLKLFAEYRAIINIPITGIFLAGYPVSGPTLVKIREAENIGQKILLVPKLFKHNVQTFPPIILNYARFVTKQWSWYGPPDVRREKWGSSLNKMKIWSLKNTERKLPSLKMIWHSLKLNWKARNKIFSMSSKPICIRWIGTCSNPYWKFM